MTTDEHAAQDDEMARAEARADWEASVDEALEAWDAPTP